MQFSSAMNKGIWVIVAITAFSIGTFVGTITPSIQVADAVQSDNTQGVQNRLESIVKSLAHINSRFDAINANFENPPDPEEPPIQAALNSIVTEANNVLVTAGQIQAKLGPP